MKSGKKLTALSDKIVFTIVGIIILLYSISLLIPILFTINTSFKDAYEYIIDPVKISNPIKGISNYVDAFNSIEYTAVNQTLGYEITYGIGAMMVFSIVIAATTAFMNVFLPSLTAYAIARYDFKGKKLIYQIAILTMIIPIIGNLASSLSIRMQLGIYDNIVPYLLTCGSGFGFNFILLHGAFKALPKEYQEAAQMDGAGHFTIMFRIYYPMMLPLFFSLFVLGFVGAWNDYMVNVVYLPSYPTLAYGVYYFQQNSTLMGEIPEPTKQAGFIIMAIPTTIIWLVSQKFIVSKMTVGGLKG